jgi:hypothetical protein
VLLLLAAPSHTCSLAATARTLIESAVLSLLHRCFQFKQHYQCDNGLLFAIASVLFLLLSLGEFLSH